MERFNVQNSSSCTQLIKTVDFLSYKWQQQYSRESICQRFKVFVFRALGCNSEKKNVNNTIFYIEIHEGQSLPDVVQQGLFQRSEVGGGTIWEIARTRGSKWGGVLTSCPPSLKHSIVCIFIKTGAIHRDCKFTFSNP